MQGILQDLLETNIHHRGDTQEQLHLHCTYNVLMMIKMSIIIIVKKGVDFMATTNITMRIDETLKAQLQELVSNLGMDMTTFFTISAKQAVREQRIPFSITMDVPNAETIAAIEDVRNGRNLSRSFSSVKELMEDLNAED